MTKKVENANEVTEMWRDYRYSRQNARENSRVQSTELLTRAGIGFTAHNDGLHLVAAVGACVIDIWPSTGRWAVRGGRKGRGVRKLLSLLGLTVPSEAQS